MSVPDKKEISVEKCLNEVKKLLKDLQYGTVTIVVQDGIPIQLDITEKKRIR